LYSAPTRSEMMQGTAYCAISLPTRSCPRNAFDFSSMGTHPFQKNARAARLLDLRPQGPRAWEFARRRGAQNKRRAAAQLDLRRELPHVALPYTDFFRLCQSAFFEKIR